MLQHSKQVQTSCNFILGGVVFFFTPASFIVVARKKGCSQLISDRFRGDHLEAIMTKEETKMYQSFAPDSTSSGAPSLAARGGGRLRLAQRAPAPSRGRIESNIQSTFNVSAHVSDSAAARANSQQE